ncbi:MAG: hypothetical protein M3270_11570 [Thermoproteota archaeon]|nr:hypothetical protein [Thermoproteota archaeon]
MYGAGGGGGGEEEEEEKIRHKGGKGLSNSLHVLAPPHTIILMTMMM